MVEELMKKVLIIGVGFLGKNIFKEFKKNQFEVFGTRLNKQNSDLFELDIRNQNEVNKLIKKIDPSIVVNCAANVQLDYLEKNSEIGYSINSEGAKNIALACKKSDSRLLQISTDGVFDGQQGQYNEEDIPNPINTYGKSKYLAEQYVSDTLTNQMIVRTNFFGYDGGKKFLFDWIYDSLKKGQKIKGFSDIIFSPLEVQNLSKMIVEISKSSEKGIIHLASDIELSKYDFIMKIADIFNFDKKLVAKGSVEDIKFLAKRPKNTSLDNKKATKMLTTKIISIDKALEEIKMKY